MMRVELDVFSGRPNPEWDLTPRESEEFIALFRSLPEAIGDVSLREGLGYRGINVTFSDKDPQDYTKISVSNGLVLAQKGNYSRAFIDKERGLELWLLETGRDKLDQNLYNQIRSAIK